jgi:putative FmdB family regulatory protein
MPIYQYKCSNCGREAELIQSISADPPICEKCWTAMIKLMTFPVQVKIDKVSPSLRKKSFGTAPYASRDNR